MTRLSRGRWSRLCDRLEWPSGPDRFDVVESAYNERHRHYHTDQHIEECLCVFDTAAHLADHADELELALWLHDLVYKTRKTDNEEASAKIAAQWIDEAPSLADVDRIVGLILVTRHDEAPKTRDEALMIDIDLNVLGAAPERYDEYESQVRREYRWVPRSLFNRKRARLLETFMERKPLYQTEWFRERLEEPARANLARALTGLRARAD